MRPTFDVTLHGTGSVEIAAYGIADAEATVEKEIRALLHDATIRVHEVRRSMPGPRIVETFDVRYSIRHSMRVEAPDEDAARHAAFRAGRTALRGGRFEKTIWERGDVARR